MTRPSIPGHLIHQRTRDGARDRHVRPGAEISDPSPPGRAESGPRDGSEESLEKGSSTEQKLTMFLKRRGRDALGKSVGDVLGAVNLGQLEKLLPHHVAEEVHMSVDVTTARRVDRVLGHSNA
eukprot:2774158-Rhodomonas_salina.2